LIALGIISLGCHFNSGRGSSTTPPGHPSGTRQGAPTRRQRVVDVARWCVPMDELLSEFAPREGGEDAVVTGPRCRLGVSGSVLRSRIIARGGIAMMLQPQQLQMSEKMSHVERRVTPPRFVEVEHERVALRCDHLPVVMVVVDRAAGILMTDERACHALGAIGNLGRPVPPLGQRRPLLAR